MTTLDKTAVNAAKQTFGDALSWGADPQDALSSALSAFADALSSLPAQAVDDRRQKYADRIAKIHGRDLDLCFGMGEFAADVTDEQKRAAMMAFFFPNTSPAPSQPAAVGELLTRAATAARIMMEYDAWEVPAPAPADPIDYAWTAQVINDLAAALVHRDQVKL